MLDQAILDQVNERARQLEEKLDGDVISYHGPIHPSLIRNFVIL